MMKEASIRELGPEEIEQVSGGKADFSGVRSSISSTAQIVETHGSSGGGWLDSARNVFHMNAIFR